MNRTTWSTTAGNRTRWESTTTSLSQVNQLEANYYSSVTSNRHNSFKETLRQPTGRKVVQREARRGSQKKQLLEKTKKRKMNTSSNLMRVIKSMMNQYWFKFNKLKLTTWLWLNKLHLLIMSSVKTSKMHQSWLWTNLHHFWPTSKLERRSTRNLRTQVTSLMSTSSPTCKKTLKDTKALARTKATWRRHWATFHLERPNRTWSDIRCRTLICISVGQRSTKSQTLLAWVQMPKSRDIGPRLKTRSSLKLSRSTRERTGRRLLRPLTVGLMCSACTGGKRSSTQTSSKDLGPILKIDFCCSWSTSTVPRNGLK